MSLCDGCACIYVCVLLCVWVIVFVQACVHIDVCMHGGLMLTLESLLMAVHFIHGLMVSHWTQRSLIWLV